MAWPIVTLSMTISASSLFSFCDARAEGLDLVLQLPLERRSAMCRLQPFERFVAADMERGEPRAESYPRASPREQTGSGVTRGAAGSIFKSMLASEAVHGRPAVPAGPRPSRCGSVSRSQRSRRAGYRPTVAIGRHPRRGGGRRAHARRTRVRMIGSAPAGGERSGDLGGDVRGTRAARRGPPRHRSAGSPARPRLSSGSAALATCGFSAPAPERQVRHQGWLRIAPSAIFRSPNCASGRILWHFRHMRVMNTSLPSAS